MSMKLAVTAGPDKGRSFPITAGGALVIGRGKTATARLKDPCVSRIHCQLRAERDEVILADCNSSAGTYLNKERIEEELLQPGDVIRVGGTQLRFEVDAAADKPKPAAKREAAVEAKPAPEYELDDLAGKTIHCYHLMEVLAHGKSSTVFQAISVESGEFLALKVLWPGIARDADGMKRFVQTMKMMFAARAGIGQRPRSRTFVRRVFARRDPLLPAGRPTSISSGKPCRDTEASDRARTGLTPSTQPDRAEGLGDGLPEMPAERRWRALRVAAPDMNGDGFDELVVLSTYATPEEDGDRLFVDVLAGRDGEPLMLFDATETNEDTVFSARWWQAGLDGAPELLITQDDRDWQEAHIVSLTVGEERCALRGVSDIQFADFNGDGLEDLSYADYISQGSQLHALAGTPLQLWRRFGGVLPAHDYDGVTDTVQAPDSLVSFVGWPESNINPRAVDYFRSSTSRSNVTIVSGRDGHVLADWPVSWLDEQDVYSRRVGCRTTTLPEGDLDKDGTPDLLVTSESTRYAQSDPSWSRPLMFPVQAVSGKTGRRLWTAEGFAVPDELRARAPQSLDISEVSVHCGDLDQDGSSEVVGAFYVEWDGAGNTNKVSQRWLAVLSGGDGRFVWRQPLTHPRYPRRTMVGLPILLPRPTPDLNGDGVKDFVLTVPVRRKNDDLGCELRALGGRDGEPLWPPRPLKLTTVVDRMKNELPTPAIEDLDGDGEPEIAIVDVDGREKERDFRLLVLRASDGEPIWQWSNSSPISHGDVNTPVPVVVKRGDGKRHAVSLRIRNAVDSDKDTIFVVDQGDLVRQLTVDAAHGPRDKRLWSHDLDGDGRDELLLMSGRSAVQALEGDGHLTWKWIVPPTGKIDRPGQLAHIESVLLGANHHPSTVVVVQDNVLFGLNGATGKPLWRGQGIRRPWYMCYLPPDGDSVSPRIVSQMTFGNTVAFASLPADASGRYVSEVRSKAKGFTFNVPSTDPRRVRYMPWRRWTVEWSTVGKIALCGLFAVVVPGAFVFQLIRRRQWSLRMWLALPILVALAVVSYQITPRDDIGPYRYIPGSWLSDFVYFAVVAGTGASSMAFPILLILWICQRYWKRVATLVIVALLSSIWFFGIQVFSEVVDMAPGEHIAWDGWYNVFGSASPVLAPWGWWWPSATG